MDFLKFAESDAKKQSKKSLINALSNIKRALHCQIDSILKSFGLQNIVTSFPNKIKLISDMGIINAAILSKINKNRNLLEHEYLLPQKNEIDDFLSATKLFISATNKFIQKEVYDIDIERQRGCRNIRLEYQSKNRVITISTYAEGKAHLFSLSYGEDNFLKVLRKYIEFIDLMI